MLRAKTQGLLSTIACLICLNSGNAQIPDHPVITEVYANPPGLNDGPVGRDPTNPHQEFIEVYVPPAALLAGGLNKDALELTLYEVEGDDTSSGNGLVNYRFDLPVIDADPSNGITSGAITRPDSGVFVLGWVDYAGNPPTALAGTPATRTALIHDGLTAPNGDYVFIAINGNQFGGTSNFPSVVAESLIDLPSEAGSGIVQNGSSAFLLVNRSAGSYVELCDDQHAGDCAAGADPALPNNSVGLNTAALLDGLASNDHPKFDVIEQPYETPSGDDIDLETVLPLGGAFSLLVPQIPELDTSRVTPGVASGYVRLFPDVAKTTENPGALDDPIVDALEAYRHIRDLGPFYPSPGRAPLTTSAPELSVAVAVEQDFRLLTQTTAGAGVLAANIGGDFPIDISISAATSDDPARVSMSSGTADAAVGGRSLAFPQIQMSPTGIAANGDVVSGSVTVSAANSQMGDPAVQSPVWITEVSATVLQPTVGTDHNGLPSGATVYAAIQGIVADGGVLNEFLNTDLGSFLAAQPDPMALSGMDNALVLTNPSTDLSNPVVVQPLIDEYPDLCCDFINPPGAAGTLSLLQTVQNSPEVLSGSAAYEASIETCACPTMQTAVRAISINHPDVLVFDGPFSPSEEMNFVEPGGFAGNPRSGLTHATTTRTFEMAIIDTHVGSGGGLETGATDDFGIVVEVAATEADATVAVGEFVFLSFLGGLAGADIDTLQVPPGNLLGTIIFLDLDNLHDVLGIRSIERIILVDGSGNGEADIIEVLCLNPDDVAGCQGAAECNDNLFCTGLETCDAGTCNSSGDPCVAQGLACDEASDSCICSLDTQCEDGLFCTGPESCNAGACVSGGNPCTGQGLVCDEAADACVAAPPCPGGTADECADLNGDTIRDDNCLWWACVDGLCQSTDVPYADFGGSNGACPPDGTADGNDRFHALNCFSNVSTLGLSGYPCELNPPTAFNVDAGGLGTPCAPDGVCDGNDAFAALNAFSGTTTCSCPGGPAPQGPPVTVGHASLVLQPTARTLRPGEIVEVDIYIQSPLDDLRGYQLHFGVYGGRSGTLDLIDLYIKDHPGWVFAQHNAWTAFNVDQSQALAGLDTPGIAAIGGSYLGTAVYRAGDSARGSFEIALRANPKDQRDRTVLFPTPAAGWIELDTQPVTIEIGLQKARARGKRR